MISEKRKNQEKFIEIPFERLISKNNEIKKKEKRRSVVGCGLLNNNLITHLIIIIIIIGMDTQTTFVPPFKICSNKREYLILL